VADLDAPIYPFFIVKSFPLKDDARDGFLADHISSQQNFFSLAAGETRTPGRTIVQKE
jgi:hypothetical protein